MYVRVCHTDLHQTGTLHIQCMGESKQQYAQNYGRAEACSFGPPATELQEKPEEQQHT